MDDDFSIISFIVGIIFIVIVIPTIAFLATGKKGIGTNMNNETKEYIRINDNSYGVTKDGTRELLKSYKFKK